MLRSRFSKVAALVVAVIIFSSAYPVYKSRNKIEGFIGVALLDPRWDDVSIKGSQARIYLPDNYVAGSKGNEGILFLHGNGESHDQYLGYETLRMLKSGNRLLAVIDGQDFSQPPFASQASGWGNSIYRQRYLDLYRHLIQNYGVDPAVDIVGASMGGIAMGRFIVDRPFSIRGAYGLGPVPFVSDMFANGGDRRKLPIRNAFGMNMDGSQDSQLSMLAKDAFWADDLKSSSQIPPLKIVAGTSDSVFTKEFGGSTAYERLCSTYEASGGNCLYSEADGYTHADPRLLTTILKWMDEAPTQ